jgi:hypothetical protein
MAGASEAPRTVEGVLARMDDTFQEFRDTVARLVARDFDRSTEAGWTVKAMIAHVAAWHGQAATRLETLRTTGRREDEPDVDSFNARVTEAAEQRSAAEVVTELGASYARLRAETARLDDAGLVAADRWAVTIIEANTFDHHPEHTAELQAVLV